MKTFAGSAVFLWLMALALGCYFIQPYKDLSQIDSFAELAGYTRACMLYVMAVVFLVSAPILYLLEKDK